GPGQAETQDLDERLAHLKGLSHTVHVFESLLRETCQLGESFFPALHPDDHPALTGQLQALQDKFLRASSLVHASTEQLESKLAAREQVQGQVTQCKDFLLAVQGEIRKAIRPIGLDAKDAELQHEVFKSLGDKLSSYAATMDQLRDSCDRLREEDQVTLADDITRLSDFHQSLADQVTAQMDASSSACSQRQAFGQLVQAAEQTLGECEASTETASQQPLEERVQIHKSVLEKLAHLEPELPGLAERAAHIGTQGTRDDLTAAAAIVETLATKIHAQKANTQTQIAQCEALQRERLGFESSINALMNWLEEKEPALASCRALQLDSAKIVPVIAKHQSTAAEAQEKIRKIREQAEAERGRFEAMSEQLPADVSDRLHQIRALEESISSAISKKERYLSEALSDRQQLENSMAQVTDWLHGASELLDSGVSGLDYDTLDRTLSEFTDYFTEASLCQDELEQVSELSEHLLPTLDSNDSATLQQTLAGVQRKYAQVMTSAHGKQGHLEQKLKQWNDFQDQLAAVTGRLDVLEGEWEEVDRSADASPDAVQSHLELVKTFVEHAETSRPLVDGLNQTARDLERAGSQESRSTIARHLQAVNDRWTALTGQAEARVSSLEEIGGQWGDFTSMLSAVQTVVVESETRLAIVSVDQVTAEELAEQLDSLKEIEANLERIRPQVSRLQTSSADLQRALPTAEAKVVSQGQFMTQLEQYHRLVKQVEELSSALQEEADVRQSALAELSECSDWLAETLTSLQANNDSGVTAEEGLSWNKLSGVELRHRMAGVAALMASLESLYGSGGRELPAEVQDKLSQVCGLEGQVEEALTQHEGRLLRLHKDRAEFRRLLAAVSAWLRRASGQLEDRAVRLPQARDDHQALLGEFDSFKADLDLLRSKGGEIIQTSPESDEKQTVQKALSEVNRQWLSLQAETADRTAALSEAADLSHAIEDVSAGVDTWLDQAERLIQADLKWTEADHLRKQLSEHRQVVKEVPTNQDKLTALGAMVKQLEQTCPAPNSAARVASLKQKLDTVHTKAGVQLSALVDADQRFGEFEREVGELMRWLQQTRARMTMRDTTTDLKSQLDVQERLLEDVVKNRARAQEVATHDPEAVSATLTPGADLTAGGHLLSEMALLETAAREQTDSLRLAVSQQATYEARLHQLNAAILDCQGKLLSSPVMADSVGALKQQMAEHNKESPDRSASLDTSPDPAGTSGGDAKVKDTPWSILQEQAQSKERQLAVALQRQERYQHSVQQLTAHMERCSVKLADNPATSASPLDTQIAELQETLAEIEDIRCEIGQARENGEQLMDAPDSEGGKALQSTLAMLEDRFRSLQALAEDKGRQLQEAKAQRERHAVERAAYDKRVAELRAWLEEAKVRHASLTLPSEDPARLQEQVGQSKDLQEETNLRLQQVSDLALQCDAVCEREPPATAERLRNQLAQLQTELGELKLSTINKQAELRAAIKDSEKRRRERDEVDTNVARLQKWMSDTKEITKPAEAASTILQSDIHKELATDIKKHRQLVRQISDRKLRPAAFIGLTPPSDREIRDSWQRLSNHLAEKRDNLQAILSASKPGDLVKVLLHAPTRQANSTNQLSEVRAVVRELSGQWRELQTELDDRKLSVDAATSFQQQYQSGLQRVSSWLDLAQQQLFTVPATTDEHIRHNE
ncbi:hypothetical protein EGW08_015320, partial [Elysia chlorotica]